MHPADLQATIKKAGFTQKALAQEYGCSENVVSVVIRTKWGSEPVMTFIANKLGKKPDELFPEYFHRKVRKVRRTRKTA